MPGNKNYTQQRRRAAPSDQQYAWCPQSGPQALAIAARWCFELGYGGAKGGGKSHFLLGDYGQDVDEFGFDWKGLLIRQSYTELEDLIRRSHQIYPLIGGEYYKGDKTWHWQNGAFLKFQYFESENDFQIIQGHEYDWIAIDEEGNYPTDEAHTLITTCIRGVNPAVPKRIRSTWNWGGSGHSWLKQRFYDPDPLGFKPMPFAAGSTRERVFIPARIWDNPILLANDPEYLVTLQQLSPELQKAWLFGDANVTLGAFLPFSKSRHILPSFSPPDWWFKFRVLDWGFSEPFACTWWCVSDGQPVDTIHGQVTVPAGSLICYREWYGCQEHPTDPKLNKTHLGIGLTNEDLAKGILSKTHERMFAATPTDSKPFQSTGMKGKNIAEELKDYGLVLTQVDTDRVNGWAQLRGRMSGPLLDVETQKRGPPTIYWMDCCRHSIRVLPLLQTDPHNLEDAKQGGEDHIPDTCRYACMTRPATLQKPKASVPMELQRETAQMAFERHIRMMGRKASGR